MRIEKISDTQVKFILSKTDLEERNIKINELAYGSEKTHMLFQEMMKQAYAEFNFEADNTPLMVEAMPIGNTHVVVVVTKISNTAVHEQPFNILPRAHNNELFKTHGLHEPVHNAVTYETRVVFSFESLDDTIMAAKRLHDYFMGQSRLYKCHGRYFIVIQEESNAAYALYEAEAVLQEYGQKHISNDLSEAYLIEHGDLMISNQAVDKLAWYL